MTVHTMEGVRTFLITRPEEAQALGDPTRARMLEALRRRPMSAKRLSEQLDMTHGRVGHHLQLLERLGLVEVVEERQVRAMTERIFALTYDFLTLQLDEPDFDELRFFFNLSAHLALDSSDLGPHRSIHTARIPKSRASEFASRMIDLTREFGAEDGDEGEVFAISGAVFRVDVGRDT